MKKIIGALVGTALVLMFTSCVSVKPVNNLEKIHVTNTKTINLLAPEAIQTPIDDMMLLKGNFGETSFSLLAYVQADEGGLYFNLMNDFGTDMGIISYDGIDAVAETPVIPEKLPVEYIINDFQNAFYKPELLKENLEGSKLKFEQILTEDGNEIRRIKSGEKIIEEVSLTAEGATITNLLRGYSFGLYFFQ